MTYNRKYINKFARLSHFTCHQEFLIYIYISNFFQGLYNFVFGLCTQCEKHVKILQTIKVKTKVRREKK